MKKNFNTWLTSGIASHGNVTVFCTVSARSTLTLIWLIYTFEHEESKKLLWSVIFFFGLTGYFFSTVWFLVALVTLFTSCADAGDLKFGFLISWFEWILIRYLFGLMVSGFLFFCLNTYITWRLCRVVLLNLVFRTSKSEMHCWGGYKENFWLHSIFIRLSRILDGWLHSVLPYMVFPLCRVACFRFYASDVVPWRRESLLNIISDCVLYWLSLEWF